MTNPAEVSERVAEILKLRNHDPEVRHAHEDALMVYFISQCRELFEALGFTQMEADAGNILDVVTDESVSRWYA